MSRETVRIVTHGRGVHIAALGLVLQIIGLIWDYWMHRQDPHLAEIEGPLTVTNPSHALVALGLAISVAGIVYHLLSSSRRSFSGSFVVTIAASVFVVATGAVGFAASGGAHEHEHAAGSAREHHHNSDLALADGARTLLARLKQRVNEEGLPAALQNLRAAADADTGIARAAHDIVHMLGRHAYDVYASPGDAFGSCTADFESGCYHGVLEGFLTSHSDITSINADDVCTAAAASPDNVDQHFQCLHGLGHGIMSVVDEDLFEALRFCDGMSVEWERTSCHGGVFMENIVRAQAAARGGESSDLVRSDDLLYPCSSLGEIYLTACYQMQGSIILWFNGFDFGAASETCLEAPRGFITTCHQGLGREVFGATVRSGSGGIPEENREALQLCAKMAVAYRGECSVAVARSLLNVDGGTSEAIDLCSRVDRADAVPCYGVVGESIGRHVADAGARAEACAAVDSTYRRSCRRGASLDVPQ